MKTQAALVLVAGPSGDDVNEQWRKVLEAIVDNRKFVSLKHASIAMSVLGYARPAEQASSRQLYRLEEAMQLLVAAGELSKTDIPRKKQKAA